VNDHKTGISADDTPNQWADAYQGQEHAAREVGKPVPNQDASPGRDYARAPLDNLDPEPNAEHGDDNLESILEIPVTLSVEIGRTKISIRNLLQLNQGSVVELDRLAGEPLDVLVNGTLVAHGEVVVLNEKFGLRVTDVVSAHERIKKLR
jgi:flagellar motor switch protein FliN/FliY